MHCFQTYPEPRHQPASRPIYFCLRYFIIGSRNLVWFSFFFLFSSFYYLYLFTLPPFFFYYSLPLRFNLFFLFFVLASHLELLIPIFVYFQTFISSFPSYPFRFLPIPLPQPPLPPLASPIIPFISLFLFSYSLSLPILHFPLPYLSASKFTSLPSSFPYIPFVSFPYLSHNFPLHQSALPPSHYYQQRTADRGGGSHSVTNAGVHPSRLL